MRYGYVYRPGWTPLLRRRLTTGVSQVLITATNAAGSGTQALALSILRPVTTSVTVRATNAAGMGTQALALSILKPTTTSVTIRATNAAGTGTQTLALTIYH